VCVYIYIYIYIEREREREREREGYLDFCFSMLYTGKGDAVLNSHLCSTLITISTRSVVDVEGKEKELKKNKGLNNIKKKCMAMAKLHPIISFSLCRLFCR
jgi:hypothetical protein